MKRIQILRLAKCYFIFLLHIVAGVAVLVLFDNLKMPFWLNRSVCVVFVFLLLNLGYVHLFRMRSSLLEYWHIRKMVHTPIAFAIGCLISLAPVALALAFGQVALNALSFHPVSASSFFLTVIIVGWEELWFRGIILNYCLRHLTPLHISLLVGTLFMLVHALNPAMNLVHEGPSLFFAGALLAAVYFRYRSIWSVVGLHLGNNLAGHIVDSDNLPSIFFRSGGYFSAMLLLVLFVLCIKQLRYRYNPS